VDGTKLASTSSQVSRWLAKAENVDADVLKDLPDPGSKDRAAGVPSVQTSDPDARVLKSRGRSVLGYNAQAVVDVDSGVVTATKVVQDVTDQAQAEPMLARAVELSGVKPEEFLADSGYDTAATFEALERQDVVARISPQDSSPLFWTVDGDQILCPLGHPADKRSEQIDRGKAVTRYTVSACPTCPFLGYCCNQSRSLQVPQGVDPIYRILAAHRARSPESIEARKTRSASIEPFFGHIKHNLKFRNFQLRGLAGVNTEFALLAIGVNLKKLAKTWKGRCASFLEAFVSSNLRKHKPHPLTLTI